jgi:hypothetical protein
MSLKSVLSAAILLVMVGTTPAQNDGPFTLGVTRLESGGACTVTGTSAPPLGTFWIAVDTAAGTRQIPGTTVWINLALSPDFWVLPAVNTDAQGKGQIPVAVTSDPARVGQLIYGQARAVDWTMPSFVNVSNLTVQGVHPAAVSGGDLTTLTLDDDEVTPHLMQAMAFDFYGTTWNTLHISSNGRISFGGGDPLAVENAVDFLGEEASIAVFWDDLDPNAGGAVEVREDPGGAWVRVSWVSVPQYGLLDASTAHCTLFADGHVRLDWETITAVDGLVGLSPGNNLSIAGPTDLSTLCWHANPSVAAAYEMFNVAGGTVFDLSHTTLSFVPLASGKYTIINE